MVFIVAFIVSCEKGTPGKQPISNHPHQEPTHTPRDTSASFHDKSTSPHPFPLSLLRGARSGAVSQRLLSRERQAVAVVRKTNTSVLRQSPLLSAPGGAHPASALASRDTLRTCAILCPQASLHQQHYSHAQGPPSQTANASFRCGLSPHTFSYVCGSLRRLWMHHTPENPASESASGREILAARTKPSAE